MAAEMSKDGFSFPKAIVGVENDWRDIGWLGFIN